MRTILVFPPQANPTYTPLGIASLAAFIRQEEPGCEIEVLNANIIAWEWVAERTPGGVDTLRFYRGLEGDFFQQEAYLARQGGRQALESAWKSLEARLQHRQATGAADAEIEAPLNLLVNRIQRQDPELVGFSIFSFSQLRWALTLAEMIRGTGAVSGRKGPRIILGGAACAAVSVRDVLEACPFIDGIVVGEGEQGLLALCRSAPLHQVPGLCFREQDRIRQNLFPQTMSLKTLPAPDFTGLSLDRALNPLPVLPLLLSRGCKWRRCRFCAHNSSFAAYRTRPVERLVDEIEQLGSAHGVHHFYFADLYVGASEAEQFADALMRRSLNIHYHILGRPTEEYTPGILEKMAASGCRWISWGVESGSQRLIELINKGTRVEVMERVPAQASDAGISNLMFMLFGLPTSTTADVEATFGFIERVYDRIDAMACTPFALFEKTSFARNADKLGLVPLGRQEMLRVGNRAVHSLRLNFHERGLDGSLRPPRGPIEAAEWRHRRRWLGEGPFLEQVHCEHYLLYVSHPFSRHTRRRPDKPYPRAA